MAKKYTLNLNGIEFTNADLRERFDKYNELHFEGKCVTDNSFGCQAIKEIMERILDSRQKMD